MLTRRSQLRGQPRLRWWQLPRSLLPPRLGAVEPVQFHLHYGRNRESRRRQQSAPYCAFPALPRAETITLSW